jgi:hypothetical protein
MLAEVSSSLSFLTRFRILLAHNLDAEINSA